MGLLRAEADAFATADPAAYQAPFPGVLGNNPYLALAGASITASFQEYIVLDGKGILPTGAPVSFDFMWGYESLLDPIPSMLPNRSNPAFTFVRGLLFNTGNINQAFGGQMTSEDFSQGNGRVVVRVTGHVGEVWSISGLLGASAAARASYTDFRNSAVADASHTGFFFLDPVTPELAIVSESGHDYSSAAAPTEPSPVPEPSTCTLLGAGLLVLVVARGRRRFGSRIH